MLGFLPPPILGFLSMFLLIFNTLFIGIIFFPITFLKAIFPVRPVSTFLGRLLDQIATAWIFMNNVYIAFTRPIEWKITGETDFDMNGRYLLISNHQTWVDIVVLQRIFHRKIPFIKFFLKKELIWVPVLGIAWWALDYPFMKRYTREEIEKNPSLKGKDIEITRKACEKFRHIPVTVMNFVEGTRFTEKKREKQNSPYKNLLVPRAGGIGFTLSSMGEVLTEIIDATIYYPEGAQDFWPFLCGKIRKIHVHIRKIPITDKNLGDYVNDEAFRQQFQEWLNQVWREKDELLETMKRDSSPAN